MKTTDFFSDFSVDGSIIVAFYWLFLWNFKKMALSEYMVVFFSNILKIYAFSLNFPLVGSVVGGFYWLFLWNFKEIKHQPFSIGCVIENG